MRTRAACRSPPGVDCAIARDVSRRSRHRSDGSAIHARSYRRPILRRREEGPMSKRSRRARVRRPRPAAREPDARLRAAQAAQRRARHVPRLLLRLALPLPEAAAPAAAGSPRTPGRRGRRAAGRQALEDRLQAHRRGQGALPGAARRERPVRLGGRELRRPLRLLRPHRRGHPAAHPGGPPQPARGAPRRRPRRARPHPRAARQLHPRAAAARARVRRARGPLAQRAHRQRAADRRPTPRARPPDQAPAGRPRKRPAATEITDKRSN